MPGYKGPLGTETLWDERGRPYNTYTQSGQRNYIPPASAVSSRDPRLVAWANAQGERMDATGLPTSTARPGQSLFKDAGTWNSQTGQFDRGANWTNIAAMGIGGMMAAPFIAGAVAAPSVGTAAPGAVGGGAVGGGAAGGGAAAGGTVAGGAAAFTPTVLAPSTIAGPAMFTTATAVPAAGGIGAAAIPAAAAGAGAVAGNPALWSDAPPGYETDAPTSSGSSNMNWGNISKWADRVGDIWGAIGKPASGAAQGLAQDRMLENDWKTRRDATMALLARDQANFDLLGAQSLYDRNRGQQADIFDAGMKGAEFNRTGQSREIQQAMLSGMLGGAQDFSVSPSNPRVAAAIPQMTGGLRPSMFANSKDSIMALLGKPQIQAPTYTPPTPYAAPPGYKPPPLTDYSQSGTGEDILGFLGLAGQGIDAYNRRNQVPPAK